MSIICRTRKNLPTNTTQTMCCLDLSPFQNCIVLFYSSLMNYSLGLIVRCHLATNISKYIWKKLKNIVWPYNLPLLGKYIWLAFQVPKKKLVFGPNSKYNPWAMSGATSLCSYFALVCVCVCVSVLQYFELFWYYGSKILKLLLTFLHRSAKYW